MSRYHLLCKECGSTFTSLHPARATCGSVCWKRRHSRHTSESILRRYHSDPEFRQRTIEAAHARRATKLGLGGTRITIEYLGHRDNWRCGICGKSIRNRGQASIDHIIPLSKGGTHELTNVHVSHRSCNQSKNNRAVGEQLLIIG